MEAKDTVMGREQAGEIVSVGNQIEDILQIPIDKLEALCKAQAEISFKAGIREVVEWFEQYYSGLLNQYSGLNKYLVPRGKRQVKLKEWGIE